MPSPREIIENKHWLGWGVAGILGVVAIVAVVVAMGAGALGTFTTAPGELTWFLLVVLIIPFLFQFGPRLLAEKVAGSLAAMPLWAAGAAFILAVLVTVWLSPSGTAPFIYFQF